MAKCETCNGTGELCKCRRCGSLYRHIHKYSSCDNAACDGERSDDVPCPDCAEQLPKMTDGRTPDQLLADGDHRSPDGRVYLPPHLTGRAKRRFLNALLTAEFYRDPLPPAPGTQRAGGDVICGQCGEKYYDHPDCPPEPCLTILCNRTLVKL